MIAFFKQLKLSPVLGYLFAGVAIGPSGFAYIQSSEITTSIAEFGVVFLLFSIGLELTFDKLKGYEKICYWFWRFAIFTYNYSFLHHSNKRL